MEFENLRVSAIDAAMRGCLPTDVLLQLMATGLGEAIELMLENPVSSKDVCTLLVAYSPGTTNTYPLYHAKMWHNLVAVRVLQRFTGLAFPPAVFRNWPYVGDAQGARRRGVLMMLLSKLNRECIASGVKVLYERLLYNMCNAHLPGVTASIVNLVGPRPDMTDAQGSAYYGLRRTYMVSADGLPHDGRPKRRGQVVERLCLFVMAGTVLDTFTQTWRHRWGVEVRVAFADALRPMVVDDLFDWFSDLPADHPTGPGAWRILLPGRRQRVACDIQVQSMSEECMEQWGA